MYFPLVTDEPKFICEVLSGPFKYILLIYFFVISTVLSLLKLSTNIISLFSYVCARRDFKHVSIVSSHS